MAKFYLSLFNHYSTDTTSRASAAASGSATNIHTQHKQEDPTKDLTIISICGMGDPMEASYDPDNNRCRPCPHVHDGVTHFKEAYPMYASQVHYLYVPCDGSVVKGEEDIGCMGHKNRVGQAEVATYIEPYVREIMNW